MNIFISSKQQIVRKQVTEKRRETVFRLFSNGLIRTADKSQLVQILEKLAPTSSFPTPCDRIVLDGAVLVHSAKPRVGIKNFQEYASQLSSHIEAVVLGAKTRRLDVGWDLYSSTSLKNTTRSRRGCRVRRQDFPRKVSCPKYYWKLHSSSLHGMSSRYMKEAGGRILLYVKDMVQQEYQRIIIHSSDADVVILAISFYNELRACGLQELWLLFGFGNKRICTCAHAMAQSLGQERSIALRGFHAFSGCDTVSSFGTKDKRTAWG
ncbi:hypothetical protein FQR65_LT14185 [Abscondita terminalis]|nr:hypothetical protein FQR65_LT14185 [Abscondita terminalis]